MPGRLPSCLFFCAVALLALGGGTAAAADCANEGFRVGLSAKLPACRAYEKVTPDEKGGFSVVNRDGGVFPAGSTRFGSGVLGDGLFKYTAGGPFSEPEAADALGTPYLFRRTGTGWGTEPLTPPAVPPQTVIGIASAPATSPDGSRSVVTTNAKLLPAAIETDQLYGTPILYLRDNVSHTYRLISRAPVNGEPVTSGAVMVEATPDLHRVIFEDGDALVPGATAGMTRQNLYEWTDDGTELGQLALVGYRPAAEGGAPFEHAEAAQPESAANDDRRTISDDGRQVLFSVEGQLYARIDGARTVAISASQRSTPDPAGPSKATYLTAARDGSTVFFASGEKLTDDSDTEGELAQDLYRYDVSTGTLADLTADGLPSFEGVIGATADADTLYFTVSVESGEGEDPFDIVDIYRWHDDGTPKGDLRFVARAPLRFTGPFGSVEVDSSNVHTLLPLFGRPGTGPEQVSPSGRWLAFASTLPLTGYENEGTSQIFRYDSQTGQILCASCDPEPTPGEPARSATFGNLSRVDPPRTMAEDGTVAFTTTKALVAADTNGQLDVYAFDGGRPQLLSTGKSPESSFLLGMSGDGTDIYVGTGQQLLASDRDDLFDIYDARIGGGFPEPAAPVPCEGAVCRGASKPLSPAPAPGTVGVAGSGNLDESCVAAQGRANRLTRRAAELHRLAHRFEGTAARRLRARADRAGKAAKRGRRAAKTCIRKDGRTAR